MVGIIFMVQDHIWIDATPVAGAEDYDEFKTHDRGHERYWAHLVSRGAVPPAEYEEYPRGRVVYNRKTRQYTLYLDRCILEKKDVVRKIMSDMQLPPYDTKTATDEHYRCSRCLQRAGRKRRSQ